MRQLCDICSFWRRGLHDNPSRSVQLSAEDDNRHVVLFRDSLRFANRCCLICIMFREEFTMNAVAMNALKRLVALALLIAMGTAVPPRLIAGTPDEPIPI